MNKVTTINLNGKAYQIEESGFEVLHAYLSDTKAKLDDNPDQEEIVKDFEQAIAEKCDKYLNAHKNVISAEEINIIIKEMGPVDTDTDDSDKHHHHTSGKPKRLYRIKEGAWIAGVCNGVAVFFDIDVKIIRLITIILCIFTHGGLIGLYILMAIFVPAAETNEEKAFARGKTFNANEFIEEMKTKYGKYTEHKYWKHYTERERHYWDSFGNTMFSFSRVMTGIIAVIGSITLAGIAIAYSIMMWSIIIHGNVFGEVLINGASPILIALFVTAGTYAVVWPIRTIVGEARRHTWNITKRKHPVKQIISVVVWLIALGFSVTVLTLSKADVDRDGVQKPYGVDFWIHHHEICIGANNYCAFNS